MPKELRAEFEAALAEAADQAGPGSLKVEPTIQAFEGRGVSKPTLYRWAAAYKASGKPAQQVARKVKAAVAARVASSPDPSLSAAAAVVEQLPVVVTVADIAGSPSPVAGSVHVPVTGAGTVQTSAVSVIERLQETVKAAEQIMRHARTPEGAVRNAKLLLSGSEHLRRCLETAVKLQAALRDEEDLHRFNDAVLAEIRKESPECAERIAMRVGPVAQRWAAEGPPPG